MRPRTDDVDWPIVEDALTRDPGGWRDRHPKRKELELPRRVGIAPDREPLDALPAREGRELDVDVTRSRVSREPGQDLADPPQPPSGPDIVGTLR